ncbi:MAG: Rrf2 family transcriptional regulator [bacterium]|nr:Rrf2 family transcriptional regulator [bacterium]
MTYITQHGGKNAVLARDIASRASVPHEYLQKLLTELVRNRVLSSARGIGGGFRLSKPPDELRLIDVIAPFDDVLGRLSSPFEDVSLLESPSAVVLERWDRVVDAYRSFLEETTLADLAVSTTGPGESGNEIVGDAENGRVG